ncbi:MAG: outer membrane protein assembly factor BamD [Betaproteobacteria bacterium]|jgi:outer membrane protein assembly factor BamD|nr:outer membrane protein assembly factor BamD [Rhodocyclaceae bacterium]MCA3135949.1 outer membrane protein assembly factor BamD [Rhodocyclaceae bacterium]MCA3143483.1 outer membrane protein assembly factor BamD [Rhodocyclaceae bacterium]MCA3146746.1 outer membrane protein assembly factor BamD [Rhodocyclaceae bacterium]MCE2899196.1 outer membrane protein assembly factor BamD [Betaproteobacteria bacterium]
MNRSVAATLAVLWVLLLGACASGPSADPSRGWTVEKLYAEAKDELNGGNYKKAVEYYEKLESRFPYGRYAQQAALEVAYAYFRQRESASAIAACDRYIKLYPNAPNVDYAYYLKGLVSFNEDLGLIAKLSSQDMTERDPKAMQESFDALRELVTRFPESKYTPDALQRMRYLVNALAAYEVKVAEYYLRRRAYVAAVNRAQSAITTFEAAPALERAFLVLIRSYQAMGLTDLQQDAERLLQANFPDSPLLKETRSDVSWWRRLY